MLQSMHISSLFPSLSQSLLQNPQRLINCPPTVGMQHRLPSRPNKLLHRLIQFLIIRLIQTPARRLPDRRVEIRLFHSGSETLRRPVQPEFDALDANRANVPWRCWMFTEEGVKVRLDVLDSHRAAEAGEVSILGQLGNESDVGEVVACECAKAAVEDSCGTSLGPGLERGNHVALYGFGKGFLG
jgi:hypothetical protein